MRSQRLPVVIFLIAALLLTACQSQAGLPPQSTTPNVIGDDYWALVGQAQDALASADYSAALNLSRQAVGLSPEEATAWELYRQASIAAVGDEYLTTLPDHRYRLPVDVFVRDRINHSQDWFVVDVRQPDEFTVGHIEGAVNIPLRDLLKHLDELPDSRSAPILLYCHSQKRSTHAVVILHELGYLKVYHLKGGYAAYEEWMRANPVPNPGPTPTPGPEEPDFGC
ncbi:MAG: rhodanese-like domain-containing protein [Anaerolineae bacterium]|jgi:rhodanese-related sulfurtransferase